LSQQPTPPRNEQVGAIERAFSLGLVTSAATAIVAVVRSKVVAIALGPAGVGMAAEINQVITITNIPAALAGGPTLIKAVARESTGKASPGEAQLAYDAAISIGMLGSCLAIPVAVLITYLTLPPNWGGSTSTLTTIGGVTGCFVLLSTAQAQVLIGAQKLREHSFATIAANTVSVLTISAGVWWWGLRGLFGATLVAGVISMILWGVVLRKSATPVRFRPRLNLSGTYAAEALRIGGGSLAGTLGTQVSLYMVRTALGRFEGPAANGLFQACWAIEGIFAQAVLVSLGNAIFPRYASAQAGKELTDELHESARFLTRVVPPMMLMGIALREIALPLLYTHEFRPAAPLLGLIFAGEIARTMAWSRAGALLYRGKVRSYVLLQCLGSVLFGGGSMVLVPIVGIQGVGWAFVGTYSVHAFINQFIVQRELGVPIIWPRVLGCYGALALAVACSVALDYHPYVAVVPVVVSIVWAWRVGLVQRVLSRLRPR